MLGGMIVWQNILRSVDITCGIYLCAVVGSIFRGGGINFVALASFAANGSLTILGYYGIKPLYKLGQVIIYLQIVLVMCMNKGNVMSCINHNISRT